MNARSILLAAAVALAGVARAATIHVATAENGGDDANDGSSGSPVATLARAVALASEDDTILFGDGEFQEPDSVTIDKNITVTSANGPTKTTFRSDHRGASGNDVSELSGWIFVTNAPRAVISGLYFCGIMKDGSQPQIRTAVLLELPGAVVTNCHFRYLRGGCLAGGIGNVQGKTYGSAPALNMRGGGTAVDCIFEKNCADRTKPVGGAVSMGDHYGYSKAASLVERCTFLGNCCANKSSGMGGAIWMSGNNPTVRDCLFIGNTVSNGTYSVAASAWFVNSGLSMYNCTAVSNRSSSTGIAYAWSNGVRWNNTVAGLLQDTSDPGFENAAAGDFHLTPTSYSVLDKISDTAANRALTGNFDLDRKDRYNNGKADYGCYEYYEGTTVSAYIGRHQITPGILEPQTNEFVVVVTPTGTSFTTNECYWTFDGREPTAGDHDAVGATVTNIFGGGIHTVRCSVKIGTEAYSVDKKDWFTVKGRTIYLVKDNANAAEPYMTWATAAASADKALAYLESGMTLVASNGTFGVSSMRNYTMPANVTVRSANGPAATTFSYSNAGGAFVMSNAGTTLAGIRIYQAGKDSVPGVRVENATALVTNCVFDSCSALHGGSGLRATAGRVADCGFYKCTANNSGYDSTPCQAAWGSGSAVFDRCSFTNTTMTSIHVRGMVMVYNGGTIRNSFVSGNTATGCPGIYVGANGHVENCTVVGNIMNLTKTYDSSNAVFIASASASVTNTIVVSNVDSADNPMAFGGVSGYEACVGHCFTDDDGDPGFVDAAKGDYKLRPSSPCVDTGTNQAWMAGAADFAGNPRIANDIVDIGYCEYTESTEPGVTIMHTVLGSVFSPQTNEFKAVITPKKLKYDETNCWWTFDGTLPTAENHQAVGSTVTNAVSAGTVTVRFRLKVGDETYGDDQTDWFEVKPRVVYLVKTNPNAASPYATWETAGTDLCTVFATMVEGMTLVISNGTFNLSSAPLTVPKYAVIRSANGPSATSITSSKAGAFRLSQLGSRLEGLCLSGVGRDSAPGVSLSQDAVVSNCVFYQNLAHSAPGAVSASQGTVVDCVFDRCRGHAYGAAAGVVFDANGDVLIDRCTFTGCYRENETKKEAHGALSVSGGATVRNSLFKGNAFAGCCAVYAGANGHIENCTVVLNRSLYTDFYDSYAVYAASDSASVVNVLAVNNTNAVTVVEANAAGVASAYVTCFTAGAAKFKDAASGDYHLRQASACVNEGSLRAWMDGATDLDGRPRVQGRPDIGCYERDRRGLAIMLK